MEDRSSTIETLITRATNPRNPITDFAAVVELCNLLLKEHYCCHVATRALAAKIQSQLEWEALQALNLLDTCMKQCGAAFHAEVGKFRFLNEMIKLVSPKYLGSRTAAPVRHRVLSLMLAWTTEYPRETKIKEAYDMLKKQGVIRDIPPPTPAATAAVADVPTMPPPRPRSSIFEDEEKSRLLQRLLQSKNPEDLQAANRLIKTMVKEDERRVEINSRRVTELESVHNNVRLLSEMLDNFRPGQTSAEDLELIKELHQSCERLRPSVFRLASETQENDAMLGEVLNASDELAQVFEKYADVVVKGKVQQGAPANQASPSLLDLSTPSEEKLPPVPDVLLTSQMAHLGLEGAGQSSGKVGVSATHSPSRQSNFDALGDIFNSITPATATTIASVGLVKAQPILQPIPLQQQGSVKESVNSVSPESFEKTSKLKALEDLDALGESLLKQNLPSSCKTGIQFTKPPSKVPMNLLTRGPEVSAEPSNPVGLPGVPVVPEKREPVPALDLDFLAGEGGGKAGGAPSGAPPPDFLNGDDVMVDLSEETEPCPTEDRGAVGLASVVNGVVGVAGVVMPSPARKAEVKPIADLFVPLESIRPGEILPLTVLEEKNGISVTLHFAKERPRPDVSVIVVTTISKNSSRLTNYLFQAVVPKSCKMRLQPPSGSDLPAFNPFLPPAAITQVMLIANPSKDPVSLKFILSYTMEDEMVTEMGEVDRLPVDA